MPRKDQAPKVWLTVLKLALGAAVLIGATGFALWYVDQMQEKEKPALGSGGGQQGWGIVGGNPVRSRG